MSARAMAAPAREEGAHAAVRVGRNFAFRIGAQVASALINVATMVMVGNYLHAEGYGRFAFWYAWVPIIGALGDLGVGIIVTRDVARDPTTGPRAFGDALMLKGLVSGALLLAIGGFAAVTFDPPTALLVMLVTAAALTELSQDCSVWVFRAHERQDVEAVLLLASQALRLGVIVYGIATGQSMTFLLAAAAIGFGVRVLIGAWLANRMLYRPRFELDWKRLGALVREGLPFGLAMFAVMLYGRIGVIALERLATSRDVAYFNVAYMLCQPLGFISTALSMAVYPVIARYVADAEALRTALRKTAKYQWLVTLPLTVGLFLLAERVIPLLFRDSDFGRAGTALKLMCLGLSFVFFNLTSRYVLAAVGHQRRYLQSILVGLVVNGALCVALIPRFGFAGACLAFVAAEAATFVTCQLTLARHIGWRTLGQEAARPAAAALGMGLAVAPLASQPLFVPVAAGGAAYLLLLFVFQAFTPQELRVARGVLQSFRPPAAAWTGAEDRT